jgi:aryl-alcohol dehydrogenase-like predicted oxidoreductase
VAPIEADVLPTCQRYGMGVIPWSPLSGGWLSGKWRKNADDLKPMSEARRRLTDCYDLSLPANQRKLDSADQLAQLAEEAGDAADRDGDRVRDQPSGRHRSDYRRTTEQLESPLAADDVTLSEEVFDRIDEIVTNINPADGGWQSPRPQPSARRR